MTLLEAHLCDRELPNEVDRSSRRPWGADQVVMAMVACLLLCLATVPLTGGRLSALADFKPARTWALWVALALQAAITFVGGGPGWLYPAANIASYGFAFVFLWANRGLQGLWLIAAGAASNSLAIVVNGGVMPATRGALESAGLDASGSGFVNSTVVRSPRLAFLGDVFAIPEAFPLSNVFSAGDVCIVVGAAVVLYSICGSSLRRRGEGGDHTPPVGDRTTARPVTRAGRGL
jgi:hypothetical protein